MTTFENDLGLEDYAGIVRRRWRALLASIVVVLVVVLAFTVTRDTVYESETEVLIMTESTTGLFSFESSVEDQLVRNPVSELQLADSEPFRRSAESALAFDSDVSLELIPPPGSEAVGDSSVVRFTARDSEPERALASAQAYADSYIRLRAESDLDTARNSQIKTAELLERLVAQRDTLRAPTLQLREQQLAATDPLVVEELNRQITDIEIDSRSAVDSLTAQIAEVGRQTVRLDQTISSLVEGESAARVLNAAQLPTSPTSPDVMRNIIVALVVGLLLGLLLVTLRELFDSSASDAVEVSRLTNTPYIAEIPTLGRLDDAPGGVVPFGELPPSQAESYDVLLNTLWLGGAGEHLGTIGITADHAGVGATQTAVNLAHLHAGRSTSVCVLDASLASPGVAHRFGIDEKHAGFADLLSRVVGLDDAILQTQTPGIDIIDVGNVLKSTLADLRSNRVGQLFAELAKRYDLVLVDLPPVSGMVDVRTVAAACDGIIMLYHPKSSQLDEIVETVEKLRLSGALPFGLVSNRS